MFIRGAGTPLGLSVARSNASPSATAVIACCSKGKFAIVCKSVNPSCKLRIKFLILTGSSAKSAITRLVSASNSSGGNAPVCRGAGALAKSSGSAIKAPATAAASSGPVAKLSICLLSTSLTFVKASATALPSKPAVLLCAICAFMSSRKPLNARPKSAMLSIVTVVRPCCLANSAYVFINCSLALSLTSLRKSIICELPTSSRLPMIVFASTCEGVRYVIFVAGAAITAGVSCSKSLIRCRKLFILASNSAT